MPDDDISNIPSGIQSLHCHQTTSLRFLSIAKETLHAVRQGAKPRTILTSEYSTHLYSTLGARIVAGADDAGVLGALFFDSPADMRLFGAVPVPRLIPQDCWWDRGNMVWMQYSPTPGMAGQEITPFRLLSDLGRTLVRPLMLANLNADHSIATQSFPSLMRNGLGHPYHPRRTAVHMACSVETFDLGEHSKWYEARLGHSRKLLTGAIGEPPGPAPLIAWELVLPKEQACNFATLDKVKEACRRFDVFASTLSDLDKIFAARKRTSLRKISGGDQERNKKVARAMAERRVLKLVRSGVGRKRYGTVVLLAGSYGCLVATRRLVKVKNTEGYRDMADVNHQMADSDDRAMESEIETKLEWLPDAYTPMFSKMSKYQASAILPASPTMFVGAFTYAMVKGSTAGLAAKQAAVAVTFMLQAAHWPKLDFDLHWGNLACETRKGPDPLSLEIKKVGDEELWLHDSPARRLNVLESGPGLDKVSEMLTEQDDNRIGLFVSGYLHWIRPAAAPLPQRKRPSAWDRLRRGAGWI